MPFRLIPSLAPDERRRFDGLQKVFVVSAGRTGTQFFGVQLGRLLPGCFSVHEPDRVDPTDLKDFLPKLNAQGPWRLVFGKALGLNGTRNLSLQRIEGRLSGPQAVDRLLAERSWVLSRCLETYAESNPQLFGLVPELIGLPRSRVAVFVRDPRTWVPSWMGKRWFGPQDWMERVGLLGMRRLNPAITGQSDPGWTGRGLLEKLCWTWWDMNQRFVDALAAAGDRAGWFRFEDVFIQRDPEQLTRLVALLAPEADHQPLIARLSELLDERFNARAAIGPRLFESWSKDEQTVLMSRCGPLARQLGYAL